MCALRRLDSFDHYTTLTQKWTSVTTAPSITAAAARTGARGLDCGGDNRSATLTIDAQGTWVIGVAFRCSQIPIGGAARTVLQTRDAGTEQGALQLNADGTLSLLRGGFGGAVVATSALSLLPNVFYYIEFKHVVANAGGTLEVRVDGAVWATFNGDTQATANPTASQVHLGINGPAGGFATTVHYDDLYILDGTGAAPNNDYQGNTQIEAILPTGPGNYTNWTTLVGAATHWEAEDEVPPDEDTSYVESSTLNQQDTFAMGNITPISATINGIQVLLRARTTLAGADNIARLYRNAGVDNQGADVALQTTYNYAIEVLALDPITAAAWTVARVNSMEMGAVVR